MHGGRAHTATPPTCAGHLINGVEGFRMSSAEARRMSASVGSLVATLPAILVDLSGSLGEKVRRTEEPAMFRTGDQYLGGSARPPR